MTTNTLEGLQKRVNLLSQIISVTILGIECRCSKPKTSKQ